MTPTVSLGRAHAEDAGSLAAISQRSFDSDLELGAPGPGGPPGYADPQWQRRMMQAGVYHTLLVDGDLVGGAIVFKPGPGEYELARIFIDPSRHRRGIGARSMMLLHEHYPDARRWTLDTPAWNPRTRKFYEGLGFVEYGRRMVGDGFELVLFEKMSAGTA